MTVRASKIAMKIANRKCRQTFAECKKASRSHTAPSLETVRDERLCFAVPPSFVLLLAKKDLGRYKT
jgi:hypothetical protein